MNTLFSHTDRDGDEVIVREAADPGSVIVENRRGAKVVEVIVPGVVLRDALIEAFPLPEEKSVDVEVETAPEPEASPVLAAAIAKAEDAAAVAMQEAYEVALRDALIEAHPLPTPAAPKRLGVGSRVRIIGGPYSRTLAKTGTVTRSARGTTHRGDWLVNADGDGSGYLLGYTTSEIEVLP